MIPVKGVPLIIILLMLLPILSPMQCNCWKLFVSLLDKFKVSYSIYGVKEHFDSWMFMTVMFVIPVVALTEKLIDIMFQPSNKWVNLSHLVLTLENDIWNNGFCWSIIRISRHTRICDFNLNSISIHNVEACLSSNLLLLLLIVNVSIGSLQSSEENC